MEKESSLLKISNNEYWIEEGHGRRTIVICTSFLSRITYSHLLAGLGDERWVSKTCSHFVVCTLIHIKKSLIFCRLFRFFVLVLSWKHSMKISRVLSSEKRHSVWECSWVEEVKVTASCCCIKLGLMKMKHKRKRKKKIVRVERKLFSLGRLKFLSRVYTIYCEWRGKLKY